METTVFGEPLLRFNNLRDNRRASVQILYRASIARSADSLLPLYPHAEHGFGNRIYAARCFGCKSASVSGEVVLMLPRRGRQVHVPQTLANRRRNHGAMVLVFEEVGLEFEASIVSSFEPIGKLA